MGKLHRQRRSLVKKLTKPNSIYENEFGELKKRLNKSEAMKKILDHIKYENIVIDKCIEKARNDIYEIEDKVFLDYLIIYLVQEG